MQFINYIDDYLIEFWFQPLAHKFQKLTGKDNFSLSYYCCFIIWIAANLICIVNKGGILFFVIVNYIPLDIAIFVFIAKFRYERENSGKDAVFQNSFRNDGWMKIKRLLLFTLYAVVLGDTFLRASQHFCKNEALFSVILCSHIALQYFVACTPLPPGTGLFRKWLDSAVGFIKGLGSNAGQPMPVPG